ncbi:MAG: ABC transporter ATP-binding protein [Oscillospiraceae bacterium]
MIQLEQVCKTYAKGKPNAVQALKDVSLHISAGELVAIIGKSGSGKTTLLNIIGCIDSFEQGKYLLNGRNISKKREAALSKIRNREIGIVVQDFALIQSDTALENVMLPFYFDQSVTLKAAKTKALAALQSVGMEDLAKKAVNQLSGGQKQRVAIARAIVHAPSVLLADEPTGALDTKTAGEIMDVFKQLHEQGKTVIIVTHDMGVAHQCDRIIEISDGTIV